MHLYERIALNIETAIKNEVYQVGNLLPSEKQLLDTYKLSRITIRKALELLESQGLVRKVQGKGVYVNDFVFWYPNKLVGFTEDITRKSKKPYSVVLEKKVTRSYDDLEFPLEFPPGAELFILKRIRCVDNEPIGLQTHILLYDLVVGIKKFDFTERSLYFTLEQDYGLQISYAEENIKARLPNAEELKLLKLSPETPVFSINSKLYVYSGRMIAHTFSIFRSDRYKIKILLKR